ncbi:hypothetical protein [Streptomyces sp. NPDC008141]|uniref:hypothetical protein n=1 Tax=Streptomyces sp. NPDC008141 TaxID=3364815 RepID=UPI0036F03040
MIIIYTPKGGEREEFDVADLLTSEAAIVSRALDMKWADIAQGVEDEEPAALRGVVWILKKRHDPNLRFSDFDPRIGEAVARLNKEEVRAYVTEAVALASLNPNATDDEIRWALRELPPLAVDPEHALSVIEELIAAAADPKDDPAPDQPSPSSDPSQTSSSPEPATSDASPTS